MLYHIVLYFYLALVKMAVERRANQDTCAGQPREKKKIHIDIAKKHKNTETNRQTGRQTGRRGDRQASTTMSSKMLADLLIENT